MAEEVQNVSRKKLPKGWVKLELFHLDKEQDIKSDKWLQLI